VDAYCRDTSGLRPWRKGQSGNPTGTNGYKRLRAEIFADLGDNPGVLERMLADRAAKFLSKSLLTSDTDLAVRLASEARRCLDRLGIKRKRPYRRKPQTSDGPGSLRAELSGNGLNGNSPTHGDGS
jgi:hypothetical protein